MFAPYQTYWGKHNPGRARLKHAANKMEHLNHTAVLPVVMVRHPYTWMYALCQHPYVLRWRHNLEGCDQRLFLQNPVTAGFGAQGGDIPKVFDSLMHVWRDWNAIYYEENSYPFLMTRLEDMVFRPKEVVTKICDCVGGILEEPFLYQQESANSGYGHGEHRSDLVTAFVKYGSPLHKFHDMFTPMDWDIINQVLKDDHGMMEALGYAT